MQMESAGVKSCIDRRDDAGELSGPKEPNHISETLEAPRTYSLGAL